MLLSWINLGTPQCGDAFVHFPSLSLFSALSSALLLRWRIERQFPILLVGAADSSVIEQ
jgi:hypothetical protein